MSRKPRRLKSGQIVPLEDQEQKAVIQWRDLSVGLRPELALLYAIPNGGSRNTVEAAKLKGTGVMAGVWDLHLPVARQDYHSLYIEMKRIKFSKFLDTQATFGNLAKKQGNCMCLCLGAQAAIDSLIAYLDGKEIPNLWTL